MGKLQFYGIFFLLVGVYSGSIALYCYQAGKNSVKMDVLISKEVANEKREKTTKEVITLSRPALRKRYCEWVRDDKDLCLKADIPIQ